MKRFLILGALVAAPAFGKCKTMTILTPNKTDMKELVDGYMTKGWETDGKLLFKEYIGFTQKMKRCPKK